jgi:2,4-dienoyl-CoA reductase-like NADH-dependent reductase (Old Yellow Enzyme family)
VTLRNRIGVSPMCQYSAEDGKPTDWHFVHLGSRAVGGASLVIVEATAVEARGRISPQDTGIWSDDHIEPFHRISRFITQHGAVAGIQLAHAGRKASTIPPWQGSNQVPLDKGGWIGVAPSAIPFRPEDTTPTELSLQQIEVIQQAFFAAARRALAAGFQWLELHAAHGYLCHEFHSPLSNQRTDKYGGALENRIRFTLETAECLRKIWPDNLPMSVRISCTDWFEGGWMLEDSITLSSRLKALGIDLIDCSSGGSTMLAKIPAGASFQVPFAEAIRRQTGILTAAVGLITEPMQADEIIRNGRADLVLLARESLRDPYWPVHAAETLRKRDQIRLPDQYEYAANPTRPK